MSSSLRPDALQQLARQRRTFGNERIWFWSSTNIPRFPMLLLLPGSTFTPTASAVGDNAGPKVTLPWKTLQDEAASPSFPPP
jgi:hypothetical protein